VRIWSSPTRRRRAALLSCGVYWPHLRPDLGVRAGMIPRCGGLDEALARFRENARVIEDAPMFSKILEKEER
jgi:hypothetical protein